MKNCEIKYIPRIRVRGLYIGTVAAIQIDLVSAVITHHGIKGSSNDQTEALAIAASRGETHLTMLEESIARALKRNQEPKPEDKGDKAHVAPTAPMTQSPQYQQQQPQYAQASISGPTIPTTAISGSTTIRWWIC